MQNLLHPLERDEVVFFYRVPGDISDLMQRRRRCDKRPENGNWSWMS